MVLLNGVQSKITVIQHNWVRHLRCRVSPILALNWPITTEAKNRLDQSEFQTFSAGKNAGEQFTIGWFLIG